MIDLWSEEFWVWCGSLIGYIAIALLAISAAFNIKSFRSFSKAYVLKWQWLWSVEERAADESAAAEDGDAVKGEGSFYKIAALTLAVLMIALAVTWLIARNGGAG